MKGEPLVKQIRLGVIGTGLAFEKLHLPVIQELQDKFQIVALCDVDEFKAAEWGQKLGLAPDRVFTDLHRMLELPDIDAFDVIVPIEANYSVTREVAAAHKPIICEKPLGGSLEDAAAHRDLARQAGVPIMIAENYRYNEEINLLRDLVRTLRVGNPVYLIQNETVDFPQLMSGPDSYAHREWRQHPRFEGGIFLDAGVHHMAALRHIFGAVRTLTAFGRRQQEDFGPFSVVQVNMVFHSGVMGHYSFFVQGSEVQRPLIGLRIIGTRGQIYLEDRDCGVINIFHKDGRHEMVNFRPRRGYYNEFLNFWKAAVGEEPLSVTPEMEFGDAKMVFDILRSAKAEGVPVDVDRTAEYTPQYQMV